MLINGGHLLEHFARLAANVMGMSAAVVGVLDRVKGGEPRRAAFGIALDQLELAAEIERSMTLEAGLTVIPDLLTDRRFFGRAAALEQANIRFAAYLPLTSPGGDRAGFVGLLDPRPRSGLTEAQIVSLRHLAGMVMADRQREQRHLHLMHVADRALRVDRMLRLVSEAESCAHALTSLLEALCRFHAAAEGHIWQLAQSGGSLVEISHYHRNKQTAHLVGAARPAGTLNELTAESIRRNQPHMAKFPHDGTPGEAGAKAITGHVCIPIWVQQQRFGISLVFTTENAEPEQVAADIESLGDTIRPALIQKVTEERMRFAAHHDDLTQLANRLMFQERLRKAIAGSRTSGGEFAVLCLDLDGFKLVNDTHGHGFGDSLLAGVAQRLRENVRETDTVARMGGDEFAIIQPDGNQPGAAIALAKRLLEAVTQPFELAGRQAFVGVSIGIAIHPHHGEGPDSMLRNADQALYRAKTAGRKAFRVYDPAVGGDPEDPFLVEQDIKDGISRGDFSLVYQPVCDAGSSYVVGFEALLRWRHPVLGPISPEQFIPLAEKSGLIVPLGQWVLETACAEAASWDRPALLSVNLSPMQFRQPDLLEQVADVLARTGLPASRLALEVTEGLLLDQSDLVLRTMRALRSRGIRIMLDDFGTAYASMSYLRRFPFDGIKIDKTFVRGLHNDDVTLAIVEAILSLAGRLKLTVVAEGVETERELNQLRNLGCRFIQGYLTGRPLECDQARALLRTSWSGDAGAGVQVLARAIGKSVGELVESDAGG